jgi:predicted DNA binding CopG/RHH family protein
VRVDFINQKDTNYLRLDDDIILYFKKRASEEKVPYQTLINAFLRKELKAV